MVEPQIVVLVVAGSSPVDHPIFFERVRGEKFCFRRRLFTSHFSPITLTFVPVAQLDRASDFGSEGWGFESLQARHIVIG
jgi:hypothetical protein